MALNEVATSCELSMHVSRELDSMRRRADVRDRSARLSRPLKAILRYSGLISALVESKFGD
jgi:hypothetical protein